MICGTCHGSRFLDDIEVIDGVPYATFTLCPECGGFGVTHCCGGECAQPEDNERDHDQ